MDLSENLMKKLEKKPKFKGDEEIKNRFRVLLRDGIRVAAQCGHNMRIETIKLEETHMWARLECKSCGGLLYLDADRKWHMDKIFGMAAMTYCEKGRR